MADVNVMFSRASDEWSTPADLFAALHEEFDFDCDCAASSANAKSDNWFGLDHGDPTRRDALAQEWAPMTCWLNPPYSRCREFMQKAADEAAKGGTVVCLVPARTDTRWWHAHVWDASTHKPRTGIEIRFIKGRLKFGNATIGALFPSVLVIFRSISHG